MQKHFLDNREISERRLARLRGVVVAAVPGYVLSPVIAGTDLEHSEEGGWYKTIAAHQYQRRYDILVGPSEYWHIEYWKCV
eukprot:2958277-Rhodomonas_salina.1